MHSELKSALEKPDVLCIILGIQPKETMSNTMDDHIEHREGE